MRCQSSGCPAARRAPETPLTLRFAHIEAGIPHKPDRVAIEIASTGENTPDAVKPVL
jgi:hypothetical protein